MALLDLEEPPTITPIRLSSVLLDLRSNWSWQFFASLRSCGYVCATSKSVLCEIAPVEAVLFDIDGTVCDSDLIHYAAFRKMLQEIGFNGGVPITEDYYIANIAGKHNDDVARLLFPDDFERGIKFTDDKEAMFRSSVADMESSTLLYNQLKGLEDKIELVPINLQDMPSWYKEKVYPLNKVPSLEHKNEVKGESLDLIRYIDSNFEGPSLFPDDPAKREFAEELFTYTDSFSKPVISFFKGEGTGGG